MTADAKAAMSWKQNHQVVAHILVADDNPHVRRLAQKYLEQAGYRVTTAIEGQDALGKTYIFRPDLIVLDADMPVMSGWEVLRRLKVEPSAAAIPVILLMEHRHGCG